MNNSSFLKVLPLLLVLVVCAVFPMNAQNRDGYFYNEQLQQNRGSDFEGYLIGTQVFGSDVYGGYNITTQQFGQDLPLGSGLWIMVGAGLGYAAHKRRNILKH